MPNMKKIGYTLKNMFKSKEEIELEARMLYNKQQREFTRYYKELGLSIKKYEKMAEETAKSGNHQNALSCAKFVLKLRRTQVRVQGLLQRFEMMRSMQQLSGVMSNFMATCAQMGLNMDANINLKDMWKNTAMMEQSLSKLDAMSEQMDEVFNAIDGGLQDSSMEMDAEEDLDSEASAFLDQIMGRSNALNSVPTAEPAAAQPAKQEAASDDSSELLSKMLQELKD